MYKKYWVNREHYINDLMKAIKLVLKENLRVEMNHNALDRYRKELNQELCDVLTFKDQGC